MTGADIQNVIIPKLKAFTGRVLVQADQGNEIPELPHIVFKIIVPYAKGTGRPELRSEQTAQEYRRIQSEEYRLTFSFTAVTEDGDTATELAQSVHDWFDFYGYEELDMLGVVIVSLGDLGNRDSVVDEEARRGFDVVLRATRELSKASSYIDKAEITTI